MKLTQIRDVLAVAEMGSLRAAGRHLGIAQPVITRSIRDLEKELEVVFFERHVKGIRLTEGGEAFIRRAKMVQAELRRLQEEMSTLKGNATGEVTLGLSTASVMVFMPAIVQRFYKRFPDVVLKVSESLFPPIEKQIVEGRVDIYVGPVNMGGIAPSLMVEPLFDNRRLVVARRGHPLSGAKSLADLTGAEWIRPTLSTRSTEGDFDNAFEEMGLPEPKIVLHARSALVALIALAKSDLLTVLPRQWLDVPGLSREIQTMDLIEPLKAPPMCIVTRRDMPLTPIAEYLCDLLRRVGANYAFNQDVAEG
ncbi:LysR substrate-binding domain-containing protein [Novosphingobium terrae]|uniref:LysR substrate-binding domain-containing protein n=1 Tax=Novosphingobium terrae TaxID=2726189 RepID=UPI0019803DE2|nr:LysR substrate-binding domain-containing protein [Novosphingobium terrae]